MLIVVKDKPHQVRCRHCRARKTLKRHPLEYKRIPSCHVCGASETKLRKHYDANGYPKHLMGESLVWVVDKHRMEKEMGLRKSCFDDCMIPIHGRRFPHEWGCKGCKHREERLLDDSVEGKEYNEVHPDEPCPF